nr:hypothetical protein BgiMline_000952 [Biomphalaria glabrata]
MREAARAMEPGPPPAKYSSPFNIRPAPPLPFKISTRALPNATSSTVLAERIKSPSCPAVTCCVARDAIVSHQVTPSVLSKSSSHSVCLVKVIKSLRLSCQSHHVTPSFLSKSSSHSVCLVKFIKSLRLSCQSHQVTPSNLSKSSSHSVCLVKVIKSLRLSCQSHQVTPSVLSKSSSHSV